jgi:hypothetical protein
LRSSSYLLDYFRRAHAHHWMESSCDLLCLSSWPHVHCKNVLLRSILLF